MSFTREKKRERYRDSKGSTIQLADVKRVEKIDDGATDGKYVVAFTFPSLGRYRTLSRLPAFFPTFFNLRNDCGIRDMHFRGLAPILV